MVFGRKLEIGRGITNLWVWQHQHNRNTLDGMIQSRTIATTFSFK